MFSIFALIEQISKNFGLRDQLLRASLSISNNIAEGFEYDNKKDFIRYLRYSKGSTGEVRSMIHFLSRTKIIEKGLFQTQVDRLTKLSKQQHSFINYLSKFDKKPISGR